MRYLNKQNIQLQKQINELKVMNNELAEVVTYQNEKIRVLKENMDAEVNPIVYSEDVKINTYDQKVNEHKEFKSENTYSETSLGDVRRHGWQIIMIGALQIIKNLMLRQPI